MDKWDEAGSIICKMLSDKFDAELFEKLRDPAIYKDVISIAHHHRIDGLLLSLINEKKLENHIAQNFLKTLSENCAEYRQRTQGKIDAAAKVLSYFMDLHIPCLCLKGVALSQCLYDNNLMGRIYSDIDILIDNKHVNEVTKALNTLGFFQYDEQAYREGARVLVSRSELLRKQLFTHELCAFYNDEISIDINILFSWKGPKSYNAPHIEFEKLWEQRIPLTQTGGWTLSPNLMFIHLCVHLYNEAVFFLYKGSSGRRETSYYRFYDVFALLQNNSWYKVNLSTVVSDVQELQAQKQVAYTCFHIQQLFGEGVWSSILKDIETNIIISPEEFNQYCTLEEVYHEWPITPFKRMNNEKMKDSVIAQMKK